ncbi:putative transposase/invertase (TIGR01784 family) [Paenibacillus eucommiae]|uniref:Transposase/invertase (TIGR01784 family) n=2 Tax=Paenibacillus eucommiae TaxID=1355755 RepID=A0ABS4J546_9BACL|nr:putative transposase/invertase (TIGR01784 family) [Paenibacillus eucommiae]
MKEDPVLKEAFEKWDELSQDPNTMFAYEMRRKQVFDEHAKVREAEIRMQRAEAKALAEGTARGMDEGKAEIIRAMLRNNLKLEQISEITGLSVAEIESLDKTLRDK